MVLGKGRKGRVGTMKEETGAKGKRWALADFGGQGDHGPLRCQTLSCSYVYPNSTERNQKYVLRNVYLPNAVVFNTPLSKYLTVTIMTLNYEGSRSSKVKGHGPNRKPIGGFLSDLL